LGNLFNLSLKIRTRSNFKKLFCLTPIKKATGFGGSYREIIMKKILGVLSFKVRRPLMTILVYDRTLKVFL